MELINLIDKKTQIKTDEKIISRLMRGASETDLAFSGLEDSMRNAFNEILQIKKKIKRSFRESTYYLSLQKIRKFYTKEGFPKR